MRMRADEGGRVRRMSVRVADEQRLTADEAEGG